jgi:WD40 repeat protein
MNPNTPKQLILQGHSRPIKDIHYTQSGDSIFTGSNDRNVIMWNAATGEKQKTYPHSAAVNIIQLTKDNSLMVTGDNTGSVYIWDTTGGVLLKQIEQDPTLCVRSIHLSQDDALLMILYAGRMKGAKSFINVYKMQDIMEYQGDEEKSEESKTNGQINQNGQNGQNVSGYSNTSGMMKIMQGASLTPQKKHIVISETCTKVVPFKTFECKNPETKYMQAKFAISNKSILVSREDGFLELINFLNGKIITESKFHNDIILDFDYNNEIGLILTASRDGTACVINFDTFQVINKFHPQNPTRNLNSCKLAVIPNPEYVSLNAGSLKKDSKSEIIINKINNVDSLFESKQPQPEILKFDVDSFFTSQEKPAAQKIKKEFIVAILSGGQDSKLVTTTNQKEGGFEILCYDALDATEMANFLTHFGPVNTMAVKGNFLASGAEDATVRLYNMDNYLFPIDKNK